MDTSQPIDIDIDIDIGLYFDQNVKSFFRRLVWDNKAVSTSSS